MYSVRSIYCSVLTRLASKWKAVGRWPLLYWSAGLQSTTKNLTPSFWKMEQIKHTVTWQWWKRTCDCQLMAKATCSSNISNTRYSVSSLRHMPSVLKCDKNVSSVTKFFSTIFTITAFCRHVKCAILVSYIQTVIINLINFYLVGTT